jgi:hypothetical protein
MPQQRPRLQCGIDLGYQLRDTEVLRCEDRPRKQRIQMIAHPERVDTTRHRGQVIGAGQRGRRIPRTDDLIAETDLESAHADNLTVSASHEMRSSGTGRTQPPR